MQIDLFENTGRYPASCGWKRQDTSREAAALVDANENKKLSCYAVILSALAKETLTVKEFVDMTEYRLDYARPRFSELVNMGKIEPSGERRARQHAWKPSRA